MFTTSQEVYKWKCLNKGEIQNMPTDKHQPIMTWSAICSPSRFRPSGPLGWSVVSYTSLDKLDCFKGWRVGIQIPRKTYIHTFLKFYCSYCSRLKLSRPLASETQLIQPHSINLTTCIKTKNMSVQSSSPVQCSSPVNGYTLVQKSAISVWVLVFTEK